MVRPPEADSAFEGADRRVYGGVRRQQPAGSSAQRPGVLLGRDPRRHDQV